MRFAIIVGALAALASAVPYPQAQDESSTDPSDDSETISLPFPTPTIPILLTTSLNIPITKSMLLPTPDPDADPETTSSSKRNPHWEPLPIFTKECKCDIATARYPCWATDALQKCNYEENFSYGCYMEAAGGCPTPTRICKNLFTASPRPGRHPCDLEPNPPVITAAPNSTTLVPVQPSLNITLPVVSTGNVSLPITLPVRVV